MKGTITTQAAWSLKDYIEHLKKCIEWIEKEGISIGKSSRYVQYLKLLEDLLEVKYKPRKEFHGGVDEPHDVLNVIREVREIDRIRRYLKPNQPIGFKTKLAEVVSGPPHYVKENSDGGATARARNIFLELRCGAEFLMQGFEVIYGDDTFPEPLVVLGGEECPCECKRLQKNKESAVKRNIFKASKQLKSYFRRNENNAQGVIVLDISKILNPDGAFLLDQDTSGGELKSIADMQIDTFRDKNIYSIDWGEHQHVAGIILFASYMTSDKLQAKSHTNYTYVSRTRAIVFNETHWFIPELVRRQKEVPSRGVSSDTYIEVVN